MYLRGLWVNSRLSETGETGDQHEESNTNFFRVHIVIVVCVCIDYFVF